MKNKTLHRVFEMAKPHRKTIIIVTLLALVITIIEMFKPYIIKIAIDDYLSKGIYQKGIITIGILGAIYIGIVILGNIIDFISSTATNMMGENVIYSIRNRLFKYTQNASIPFHDKTPAGKLFVRITNDVEDISTLFKDVLTTFFKDIILIIGIVVVMLVLSAKLSMLSFIVIPFIIIFSITLTRLLNKIYSKSKVIKTELNTFLAESIYGSKLIKIFNIQKEKQQECEKYTTDFRNSRLPSGIIEGLLPALMTILENLAIAIIVWACVNHWFNIGLDVGLIYVFITYIKQLFEPITRTIENMESVQEAFVSINKIYDILDRKEYLEDLETGTELKNVNGKIEFKNVWFSYDNKNWVLKNVSFTIEPGQSVALVGKTGCGKTTITNLINRFYEIQQGEILLDGVNIKNINKRSLREHIGIILQDPFIFARSIKENIKLNSNISDEDIDEAIRLSSAEEFVNSLPNGVEEIAKERGTSFSAGQKQLLAFARIFAHNPSIFILDEATANIDTYTEQLIQKSIDTISAKKTSIFIAHRLATIVNVDKIIVLDAGEIVEMGSHNELLHTGGYYSKLYNSYYASLQ
ncbi:MAG: ABC transporter ATP-binding protein [Clostridia bacterium]|nr:ABC transporter ATP-binding protein [Clostridia bacterium]